MDADEWLLTPDERGNPATGLDSRHHPHLAHSPGNVVTPLVHGVTYFKHLFDRIAAMGEGDLLLFTDWRGDPDQWLVEEEEVGQVLCAAAERGVIVKGLIWRSHMDKLTFSAEENRHLGDEIEAAGGECLLDMRVRTGGSHHQKFVVLRHPDEPERDIAYLGGIDLCRSRRDDAEHHGDKRSQSMSDRYGETPPWHDVQVAIQGPAVGDVETVFRERWTDPQPLTRNPFRRLRDYLSHEDVTPDQLPEQLKDPEPRGPHNVQLLRTYPYRRSGYAFAPDGERSIARGYEKALRRARTLIYLEDQYLWSPQVARCFAEALAANPDLHLLAVVPRYPDQDGAMSEQPQSLGRELALEILHEAADGRIALYSPENHAGTPVYVHAKVCIVDDVWATVGSDNMNRRSWTHDSELSCAVIDETLDGREPRDPSGLGDGARTYARDLRLTLSKEHLDTDDDAGLLDPTDAFQTFAASAKALDDWYAAGQEGSRPPGRLRVYDPPRLSRLTKVWSWPMYHLTVDPDGRPPRMRRSNEF